MKNFTEFTAAVNQLSKSFNKNICQLGGTSASFDVINKIDVAVIYFHNLNDFKKAKDFYPLHFTNVIFDSNPFNDYFKYVAKIYNN